MHMLFIWLVLFPTRYNCYFCHCRTHHSLQISKERHFVLCLELIAGTSVRINSFHLVFLSISYITNCLRSCMFDFASEWATLKKEVNSSYKIGPKQTSDSNLDGFILFFSLTFTCAPMWRFFTWKLVLLLSTYLCLTQPLLAHQKEG